MSATAHHPLYSPAPDQEDLLKLLEVLNLELANHPKCPIKHFDGTAPSAAQFAKICIYLLQRDRELRHAMHVEIKMPERLL